MNVDLDSDTLAPRASLSWVKSYFFKRRNNSVIMHVFRPFVVAELLSDILIFPPLKCLLSLWFILNFQPNNGLHQCNDLSLELLF